MVTLIITIALFGNSCSRVQTEQLKIPSIAEVTPPVTVGLWRRMWGEEETPR